MGRVSTLLLSASLVAVAGCGIKVYETRLEGTIEDIKHQRRLDAALLPAQTAAPFKDFPMYLRPPKSMTLAQTFIMAEVPAGQYDLAASFQGSEGVNLHVLGRRKEARKAQAKNAPAPEPAAPRNPFEPDVLGLLASIYGGTPPAPTDITMKLNRFRRTIFKTPDESRVISAYFYGSEKETYQVALIFDSPASAPPTDRARDLCLETFAVGRAAIAALGGGGQAKEGEGSAF